MDNEVFTGKGKIKECIIKLMPKFEMVQPDPFHEPKQLDYEYDRIIVVMDHGWKDEIKAIPGLFEVYEDSPFPRYICFVDPRFDTKWVMAEIEARIKLGKPENAPTPDPKPVVFNDLLGFPVRVGTFGQGIHGEITGFTPDDKDEE